jgi:hypothetical protein
MTNEHVANIAITVTAAMLATAAVAFTLSGNAPSDPRAGDLPSISVGAKAVHAVTADAAAPAQSTIAPPVTAPPDSAPALTAHAPSSTSTKASAGPASASGATGGVKAGAASSTGAGTTKAADSDDESDDEDDHEVVVPKVHETDEHEPNSDKSGTPTEH